MWGWYWDDAESSHDDLSAAESDTLDGWVDKFKHYSSYPMVGKVGNVRIGERGESRRLEQS